MHWKSLLAKEGKRKHYDKSCHRKKKGKVPKSSRKEVRDKSRKVLQRRAQFPLRELIKSIREKIGNSRKGKAKFPFGDSVGKA